MFHFLSKCGFVLGLFGFGLWAPVNGWAQPVNLGCIGEVCDNYTLSGNEDISGLNIEPADRLGWSLPAGAPTLNLGSHILTITNSMTIDAPTHAPWEFGAFWILGEDGELRIGENAKFTYTAGGDALDSVIKLGRLNLFGEFVYDGVGMSRTQPYGPGDVTPTNPCPDPDQPCGYNQISAITFNPGSKLHLKNGSAITWAHVSPSSLNSGTTPLEVLEIIGAGGVGNEATFVASTDVNGGRLHTDLLQVNLLDSGIFDNGTVLLHVDTDTEGLSQAQKDASGIAPDGIASFIGFSLGVVDEYGQASTLKNDQLINSTFTLVDKISNNVNLDNQRNSFNDDHKLNAGPYLDIILRTFLDEANGVNDLSLKGTWTGYNADKSVPLLEGMAANAIALKNGADLLTGSGLTNALALADPRYGQRGFGLFSSVGGYSQTFSTGSHVDYKGFSFVGGPALNYDTALGHLLLGAFLEGGRGDYDTTNQFKIRDFRGMPVGQYSVKGDGKNDYLGAGLFVRHDFNQGYYTEASIRGGRLNNEFSSSDMGPNVKYKADGSYLGLHGGLGYRYEYKPGLMIDAYGKVYWDRIDGDSLTTKDGMKIDFDEAEFLRTRLGVRYTKTLTEALGLTVGGAWDYSFGDDYGSYQGTVGSLKTPIAKGDEPSLEGSSGILELGLEYKPFENKGLSLALSGKAYLGKVEGGSGSLMLKYLFGGSEESSSSSRSMPSFGDAPYMSGSIAIPERASVTSHLTGTISTADNSGPIRLAQSASGEESIGGGEATVTLETVTVYSEPNWKQTLSPGTVSVVVPDDYKGEQKSLGDLLDSVPGLHVNKRGGSGQYTTVNVRGSTSAQVGLYIDGVPQNTAGDPSVDLSLYTSENIARIEVYKGYIPVRFVGAPIGGVINIVTKKAVDQSTTLSAGARSHGGFQSNGLFTTPLFEGSLLLSATRDQSEGDFKYDYWQWGNRNLPHPERWRKNNSHQKTDVMAKWQNENISIQGGWKEMDRYYPATTDRNRLGSEEVDLNSNAWSEVNRRNRQQVLERDLVAGYRNDWGDLNWGIQAEYKNSVKDFRWEEGAVIGVDPASGEVWSKYDTDRWGVTLDASYKLGERNMLEFTGNYTKEEMSMVGNDWHDPNDTYHLQMQNQYEQKSLYLQLQDTITMRDDLWLTLILRGYQVKSGGVDTTRYNSAQNPIKHGDVNFNTDDGKFNSTWGVAVKKNVGEHWSFKATGGTFIRYPNFYELFGDGVYIRPAIWNAENIPLPMPEKGEQWDITVEWNGELPWLETPGNFSVTYFTRRTEDMIGLYQTPYYVYYGNYGKNRASGVELEAGLKSTYVDVNFSATWMESEVLDMAPSGAAGGLYGTWWAEGSEILNSPQWETNLRVDLRQPWLESVSFFAEHHYTSEVPIAYTAQDALRYEEDLQLVNLGLRAELAEGLLLTAGINDVFNKAPKQGYYDSAHPERGTSTLFFPKEGRACYGTLQYTF